MLRFVTYSLRTTDSGEALVLSLNGENLLFNIPQHFQRNENAAMLGTVYSEKSAFRSKWFE